MQVSGGAHTGGMAQPPYDENGAGLPTTWSAPDDARELELDRLVWHREEQARRRRAQLAHAFGGRTLLAASCLVLVLLAASFAVVVPVVTRTTNGARPLAHPTSAPGRPGGLLPAVTLQVGAERRPARALRPAVLALLPTSCSCAQTVAAIAGVTQRYGVTLVVVSSLMTDTAAASAAGANVFAAYDADGRLAADYASDASDSVTALLVRADGVVSAIERDLSPDHPLGESVAELTR